MNTYQLLITDFGGGTGRTKIDLTTWSRWEEVVDYAVANDIEVGEAMQRLINSGLSHQKVGVTK